MVKKKNAFDVKKETPLLKAALRWIAGRIRNGSLPDIFGFRHNKTLYNASLTYVADSPPTWHVRILTQDGQSLEEHVVPGEKLVHGGDG